MSQSFKNILTITGKNILTITGAIFTTIVGMVEEKPLYNEDFMDKFSDPEDKRKLDEVVQRLKVNGDNKPHTITLKNNDKVTIVVN